MSAIENNEFIKAEAPQVKQEGAVVVSHRFAKSDSRQHQCIVCLKAFSRAKYLEAHMVVHRNVKPFNCGTCNQSFRFSTGLLQHASIHKENNKVYKCPSSGCPVAFRLRGNLKQHMRRMHYKSEAELKAIWENIPSLQKQKASGSNGYVKREIKSEGNFGQVSNTSGIQSEGQLDGVSEIDQVFLSAPAEFDGISPRLGQLLQGNKQPPSIASQPNYCEYCAKVVESKKSIVAHLWEHVSEIKGGMQCFECVLVSCDFKSNVRLQALAHRKSHREEEGCKIVDQRKNLDAFFESCLHKYFKNLDIATWDELYATRHL